MSRTVLYVEDNEFNRKIVRQLLVRTTYRLREAFDGESGVAMATEDPPDVVLMDVQLPRLSGLEATRAIRNDPRPTAKELRWARVDSRPPPWAMTMTLAPSARIPA